MHARSLVAFHEGAGTSHSHNFTNTYLSSDALQKPSRSEAAAITNHTQDTINKILGVKNTVAQKSIGNQVQMAEQAQFIRYTPNQPGAGQRIIKMKEVQADPLNPAQFKHKRVARGPPSPPVTIMRSPPKKLTVKDQQDWKVPPCISNWKNARGYTIPLEMRLSADGRTLKHHTINEKFGKFADAMFIAEKQAAREIEERNQIQQSIAYNDYLRREDEMRQLAREAKEGKEKLLREHMDKEGAQAEQQMTEEQRKELRKREVMRYVLKREQESELRAARAGINKNKFLRDAERDVSERVALGQAQPTLTDSLIDQRLLNQDGGLDSGFVDDDENRAFDKPLFPDREVINIYGGLKTVQEGLDDDPETETNLKQVIGLGKRYQGVGAVDSKTGTRTRPVEFERDDNRDEFLGMQGFVAKKKQISDQ